MSHENHSAGARDSYWGIDNSRSAGSRAIRPVPTDFAVLELKLNVIMRTPGGASLHSWSLGFSVKCGDNNQPLTPITHEVPPDLTASLFRNVGGVEIAEVAEAHSPAVRVQPCS